MSFQHAQTNSPAPLTPPSADLSPQAGRGNGWRPYVIGFLIGAVILTVLPLGQRLFLKAPAPLRQLTSWEVPSLGGGPVSSAALAGTVVLVTTELGPCDEACLERQKNFGLAVKHVDDLKGGVVLLSLVGDEARAGLQQLVTAASPAWRFGAASADVLAQFQGGLDQFLAPSSADFGRAHVIALIDQNGAVRGYWQGDGAGRGNSINAARLLAKHGPTP